MNDQEINEAVARKLGWTRCNDEDEGEIRWHTDTPLEPGKFGGTCSSTLPDYCTSIAAAWEVVEHCRKLGPVDLDGDEDGYRFFCFNPNGPDHFGIADTAPMAICLAFLKLGD